MTAAFDGTRGTDQRFSDALSGSDGTSDPSVMMPVLDVYPDALSAPMPLDVIPMVPLPVRTPPSGVRADPVIGPAGRPAGPSQRAAQQGSQRQGSQRQSSQRQGTTRPPPPRQQVSAQNTVPPRPRVQSARPITAVPPAGQQPHTISWQGRSMSASDIASMVRASLSGQSTPQGPQSFQTTHPQSMGSAAPPAVAPAAPMASQYSGHGQARNDARERSQERRRTAPPTANRSSSVWAVLVFMVVILFATGLGQQIIEFITELLNR